MLSRGTCYEPTCKTAVLRMTKTGTPRVNVQIAHIYSLGVGEARFDEKYPKAELNKFKNLLLLCQTHHTEVDSELWVKHYRAEVLIEWKRTREGDLSKSLEELPELFDDEQFQDVLTKAISRTREEIIAAIDKVTDISQETLTLLKELVSESFTRPYLSEEAVASLEYSARVFDGMGDQTRVLYESAHGLQGIDDHAWMLRESSHGLREIPDYVTLLRQAAHDLNTALPHHTGLLADAASKLVGLPDYAGALLQAAQKLEAAGLSDAVDRIDKLEEATRQLNSATTNALESSREEEDDEPVYQTDDEPVEEWSWKSFRIGVITCFVAVVILLVLWNAIISK